MQRKGHYSGTAWYAYRLQCFLCRVSVPCFWLDLSTSMGMAAIHVIEYTILTKICSHVQRSIPVKYILNLSCGFRKCTWLTKTDIHIPPLNFQMRPWLMEAKVTPLITDYLILSNSYQHYSVYWGFALSINDFGLDLF